MKYSIITQPQPEETSLPINISSKIFSNYNSTIIATRTQQHTLLLTLGTREDPNSKQNTAFSPLRKFEVPLNENFEWEKLNYVVPGEGQWILLLAQPLRICYVIEKYNAMISIQTQWTLHLEQMQCLTSLPDLYVYGHEQNSFRNTLYSINRSTFDLRQIKTSKDHSPQPRVGGWHFFSDSRLYVTGGQDKKGKEIEPLMWTFNMDNGYWFALEFNSGGMKTRKNAASCQFENGKVLVVGQDGLYVVELYQSRARQLHGWKQTLLPQQLDLVQYLFIWEGWLYIKLSSGLLPVRCQFHKEKQ